MAAERKKHFGTIPRWRIALKLATLHAFRDDYLGSRWYDWEKRIKDGHNAEENKIKKQYEKALKTIPSDDPYFTDLIAEEYVNTSELTNNMCAALIVSIWSEMESFLKSLVRACYTASGENKKLPGNIEAIKKEIKREVDIQLDKCRDYSTVDAIRILNNAYKHSSGYYHHETDKPYSQVKKSLLKKWRLQVDRQIEYSKLPIKNIVESFAIFCTDVMKKVESKLEKQSRGLGNGR